MLKLVIIFIVLFITSTTFSQEKEGYYLYGVGESFGKYQSNSSLFLITDEPEWIDVQTGLGFVIALKNDGTIWGIGSNIYGQLGMGLEESDTVYTLTQIGTDNDWKKISTKGVRCLAIKEDGTLWAWGENNHGGVGDGTTEKRNIPVKISERNDWENIYALMHNSFATTKDTILYGWGHNTDGQSFYETQLIPTIIDSTRKIIEMSDYSEFINFLIDKDNNLWQMEYLGGVNVLDTLNIYKLSDYQETPKLLKLDGSLDSYFAMDLDSNLWYYGEQNFGEFGNGSNFIDADVLIRHNNYNKVKDFSLSYNMSGIIVAEGFLYSSGINFGQFDSTLYHSETNIPIKLSEDNDWVKVSCKLYDLVALKKTKMSDESNVKRVKSNFNIYPNPSTGKFNFNLNAEFGDEIKVIDLKGVEVFKSQLTKKYNNELFELDLSGLKSGIYFIEHKTRNKIYSDKLIIEK